MAVDEEFEMWGGEAADGGLVSQVVRGGGASADEEALVISLRPSRFDEYVGQDHVKSNLQIACSASKRRGEAMDHVLLHGPPGLGKTSLARIVSAELGVGFKSTSGPAIERPGDLAAILTSLSERDVLFIDEIHRLSRAIEEVLYPAMEDFELDIVIGQGQAARSVKISRLSVSKRSTNFWGSSVGSRKSLLMPGLTLSSGADGGDDLQATRATSASGTKWRVSFMAADPALRVRIAQCARFVHSSR